MENIRRDRAQGIIVTKYEMPFMVRLFDSEINKINNAPKAGNHNKTFNKLFTFFTYSLFKKNTTIQNRSIVM